MGDADIIPLGTRGRPGRGTGRSDPSNPSRALGPRKGAGAADPGRASGPPQQRQGRPGRSGKPAGDRGSEPATGPDDHGPDAPQPPEAASGPVVDPPPGEPPGQPIRVSALEALAAVRSAAREVFGEDYERRLAELLAFLRRRVTGEYEVDDYGFDPEVTDRFLMAAIRPLAQRWFRLEVRGAQNIPRDGGALIVSNHSGTIPLDGLVTTYALHEHTGRHLRPLGADLLFRLPVVSEIARRSGATLACSEDAHRMLAGGELVGVWPEGFKGIGKPYSERYKLQRFGRGGFVSAAVRTGVPIVPCSVVGAEEIYPMIGNLSMLARAIGAPYLPVTPTFPLLGPLGLVPLPSKWIIEFGEPIRTDAYEAGAADDPMLVFDVTDQVRETIQQTLYKLLMQRTSVFR